jgi:peptidoglycan/LPS O-acetylase OafA/YrhL
MLLPFFAEIQSPAVRLIAGKIATYSYGIYISHQFCIWFATDVLYASAPWMKSLFLVITICGLPILLYHYIEKPFIDFGKQFSEVKKVA